MSKGHQYNTNPISSSGMVTLAKESSVIHKRQESPHHVQVMSFGILIT